MQGVGFRVQGTCKGLQNTAICLLFLSLARTYTCVHIHARMHTHTHTIPWSLYASNRVLPPIHKTRGPLCARCFRHETACLRTCMCLHSFTWNKLAPWCSRATVARCAKGQNHADRYLKKGFSGPVCAGCGQHRVKDVQRKPRTQACIRARDTDRG